MDEILDNSHGTHALPLGDLEFWDDDVQRRYPRRGESAENDSFRNYDDGTRDGVKVLYEQNHRMQTVEFAYAVREKYLPLRKSKMSVWEAMRLLDQIVDDSDPDTESSQIFHAIQTAEAVRADGHPDWFVVTALIHDLGKVLCLFDEPQWAVVGDTFPVGCRFSEKVVLPEFFAHNPDASVAEYQTECGIYAPAIGLNNVMMSWGHDEYLYHVTRNFLPEAAQYVIRYHSFYSCHREHAYEHLMNDQDREMFQWVRAFNDYDLYTKSDVEPDVERLLPTYERLVTHYFPEKLQW